MKTILTTLAAATALVAFAGTAHAQERMGGSFTTTQGNGGPASIGTPNGGTETNAFQITGTVQRDCSFFTGTTSKTINIGTIGIIATSDVAVQNAFNMAGPARGQAQTSTAGCNFNNFVSITKANADRGLVNFNAGGFDSNTFQANIPYTVTARFNASAQTAVGQPGTAQTLVVAQNEATKIGNYGAWRSQFTLDVDALPPALGLVAGDYVDTVTVVFQTV